MKRIAVPLLLAVSLATTAEAQSLNIDFGEPADGPPASYGAAGLPGVWNSVLALHGTTTLDLVDLDGVATAVSLQQIGGLDNLTVADPATGGDHALLMDDYLVTFDAVLESCIFLKNVEPGSYEVLVYARMPAQPAVRSYTDVDQEAGNPHYEVGGAWPGGHQLLVTYARHLATVGVDGRLDLHSGIAPGADPSLGAALNGVQVRKLSGPPVFGDGFETGDASAWALEQGLP